MELKILEVTMAHKKEGNKYWIYGEDAALAARFTKYLTKVLYGNAKAGKKLLIPAIARMSDRGLNRILLNGKYV